MRIHLTDRTNFFVRTPRHLAVRDGVLEIEYLFLSESDLTDQIRTKALSILRPNCGARCHEQHTNSNSTRKTLHRVLR